MTLLNFVVVLLAASVLQSSAQEQTPFFRKDYSYLDETKSFYKIHTLTKTWSEAKTQCEREGATFFYPEQASEANAVITLWAETQSYDAVYIGISDVTVDGVYQTVDGRSVLDVYNNWAPGEPNNAKDEGCVMLHRNGSLSDERCDVQNAFICKKTLSTLVWNSDCNLPDPDYVYNATLGKCYKFHLTPVNWTEAVAYCDAEQSYLTILNSQAENDYLVKLTEEAPIEGIKGDYLLGAILLGFFEQNKTWLTIKGTPLEDTGFNVWSPGQPDGQPEETCGSMFNTGNLNDLDCYWNCFFVCEHDVEKTTANGTTTT